MGLPCMPADLNLKVFLLKDYNRGTDIESGIWKENAYQNLLSKICRIKVLVSVWKVKKD